MLDYSLPGDLLCRDRLSRSRRRQRNPLTRFGQVNGAKSDHQRQRRHGFEVNDRAQRQTADGFEIVPVSGNPDHQGSEDERNQEAFNKPEEDV